MNELELQKRMAANGEELARLQSHMAYIDRLLEVSKWLTFLLYLAFCLSLYLGDILHLESLLTSFMGSAPGFVFYAVICLMLAYVLAGIKHAAYSHFAIFGRVVLIIAVVVSMGLLAEVFQSSANQDTKARAVTESGTEYQALVNHNPAASVRADVGLVAAIAKAQQVLARCEEKLKAGKEKHCEGDKAKLQALQDSQTATTQAQLQAAAANETARYDRLDKLKTDGYNPTIRAISDFSGVEIATAIVLVMLFISAQFECLHWWLSEMKARTLNQLRGIKGGMDRLEVDYYTMTGKQPGEEVGGTDKQAPAKMPFGFHPSASATGAPALFKYQDKQPHPVKSGGFVGFWDTNTVPKAEKPTPANQKTGTAEVQLSLPEISTWNRELSQHGIHCPADDVLNQAADKAQIERIIQRGLQAAKPCVITEEKPCVESTKKPCAQGLTEPVQNPVHRVTGAPVATGNDSLYSAWVVEVKAGHCRPSVEASRRWIQQKIAPTMTGSKTNDLKRIDSMCRAFFARAMKEGLMQKNPNYRNGGKKYIWIGA